MNKLEILTGKGCVTDHFGLAVAAVILGCQESDLSILLTRRSGVVFEKKWALPGGVVQIDESLPEAVVRIVAAEAELHVKSVSQLFTFGDVDRYPGKRLITTAFYSLTRISSLQIRKNTNWKWFSQSELPSLAIDHNRIIEVALHRLQRNIKNKPFGEDLLPDEFTISELQELYEAVLGRRINTIQFRRQIWGMDLLIPVQHQKDGRKEQVYRFNKKKYRQMSRSGLRLEI